MNVCGSRRGREATPTAVWAGSVPDDCGDAPGLHTTIQSAKLQIEDLRSHIQMRRMIMCQTMVNPAFVSGDVCMQELKAPGSGRESSLRLESSETGRGRRRAADLTHAVAKPNPRLSEVHK